MSFASDVPSGAPNLGGAFHAVLRTVNDQDGRSVLDQARAESRAVRWNQGFHAYAEAILAGRHGRRGQASDLAAEGRDLLEPFASRWNHLLRWLTAAAALHDGWGDPVLWLSEAAVDLTAAGHMRLAASCRAMLRQAGGLCLGNAAAAVTCPPRCRSWASPVVRWMSLTCGTRAFERTDRRPVVHFCEDGRNSRCQLDQQNRTGQQAEAAGPRCAFCR